jgi:dipeptidyl-peptidase 4
MKTDRRKLKFAAMVFLAKVVFMSGIGYALAQDVGQFRDPVHVPDDARQRLQEIFEGDAFAVKSFHAGWFPDGSGYLVRENESGKQGPSLVSYDAATGDRGVIISSEQLHLPGETTNYTIQNYAFSPDGSRMLIQAVSRDEEAGERRFWMFEPVSGDFTAVEGGYDNQISPGNQKILFGRDGTLYVYDLKSEQTTALTNDAAEGTVSNSRALWSPDGSKVAFVRSDASAIRKRSSLIPGDPTYPEVREVRYARVGGNIQKLQIGVVDAKGLETIWLPISVPSEGYYLGEMSWAGNSDELLVEKRSRFRDKRWFLRANVNTGRIKTVFEETDPAWVVASYGINGGVDWVQNHSAFILLNEKDGWRHAYLCTEDGAKLNLLTPGKFDVIDRAGVDESEGLFYFYASPDNGTQKYLYQVRLDGKGKPERVTPSGQPGTHDYSLSPDGKWAFHTYSSHDKPPVTELVKLPVHETVRVLEDNSELRKRMASLNLPPKEFIKLTTADGIEMDAWMIKPRDFDPSGKYPVFVYVYGEPHAQTVKDLWGHAMTEYHRVIADLGYIVVSIDNRGTPCPKGAAWRRAIAGSLGPLSTEEQAEGLEDLARTRPWIDLSRVGIWGWSGGGSNTLNALFRRPDIYDVGIAVAPKPQPHLYNAWFQEIYMKTPEINPEGYQRAAPINFAEGLEGSLLLVHGSGETNTHVQITEGLVDKLIGLGKPFDYMCYPNRDHGIRKGKGTTLHLRMHMVRYLLNHLFPGPH